MKNNLFLNCKMMFLKLCIPFVLLSTLFQCKPEIKEISNDKKAEIEVEKEMGLGLLSLTFNKPLKFYKNPTDSVVFDQIEFIKNSQPETRGRLLFISKTTFSPYRMQSGDTDEMAKQNINHGLVRFGPELFFRVLEKTDSFFKVVIDEDTFESAYLKINPNYALYTELSQVYANSCSNCPGSNYNPDFYIYETWENYFKRLEFITIKGLDIYSSANGIILLEKNNDAFLPFQVTALEGDWIKIKKAKLYESYFDNTINYDGWVRWKNNMEILVDITEHTYE
ncbi:hypothetical protein FF125_20280 [Aureibaculum algae]|uniref:Uncharacterized protein n=1 Tax=Aureibaculum algae TaxID=2584122 RepID=A0A5B7TZ00_9FLAO|nr:hypothetical protein [Aureibaculum algae]QCX40663.1 hypothetical protein FF125_20280 [Aureibaculum algae]